jgi:hypothetical protein
MRSQFRVLRPSLSFLEFDVIPQQQPREDDLDLVAYEEPAGTGVDSVAEVEGVFACGDELVAMAYWEGFSKALTTLISKDERARSRAGAVA